MKRVILESLPAIACVLLKFRRKRLFGVGGESV